MSVAGRKYVSFTTCVALLRTHNLLTPKYVRWFHAASVFFFLLRRRACLERPRQVSQRMSRSSQRPVRHSRASLRLLRYGLLVGQYNGCRRRWFLEKAQSKGNNWGVWGKKEKKKSLRGGSKALNEEKKYLRNEVLKNTWKIGR